MAGEYIFTMQDLIKRYGRNEVLSGINLSFYHGAKTVSYTHLTLPTIYSV